MYSLVLYDNYKAKPHGSVEIPAQPATVGEGGDRILDSPLPVTQSI